MNIYLSTEKNFDNNGLGFLIDCLSANVVEELNGEYGLNITYPINSSLSSYLVVGNIIKTDVGDNNYQLFRISQIEKGFKTISIYARHIYYDLLDNFIEDSAPTNLDCASAAKWLLDRAEIKTKFEVYSDAVGIHSARYVRRNPIECFMGNIDNSLVNLYNVEIERDNYLIKFLKQRGNNKNVKLIIGKNIKDINVNIDISSLFTRIMPLGYDGLMLPEKYIDSPLINNYPTPKIGKYEFSNIKYDPEDEEAFHTLEEAYQALRDETNLLFVAGIDKPVINIKIDWLELSKTKEYYEKYNFLEKVSLGDTITAEILGLNFETRVIKTTYNVLTKQIDKFEIGTFKPTFQNTVNTIVKNVEDINPSTILEQARDNATKLLTSAMGGYVYKTHNELFIMDNDNPNTATKVWRWNLNGLGYSKNGINGPYEIAITQDGSINADFITSGKINTNLIEGYEQLILTVTELNNQYEKDMTIDKKATGYPIVVEDAGAYNVKELKVYGNSEQDTSVQGKNFLDIKWFSKNCGSYWYSDIQDTKRVGLDRLIEVKPNTYYTISVVDFNLRYAIQEYNSLDTNKWLADSGWKTNSTYTFLTSENTDRIWICVSSPNYAFDITPADVQKSKFQLEEGNVATDIEPFIPNMPSPDYPSEVRNIEPVENLLNPKDFSATQTINGVTFTNNGDGTWNIHGIATNAINIRLYNDAKIKEIIKPNTSYSFYCNFPYSQSNFNINIQISYNTETVQWLTICNKHNTKNDIITNCYFNFHCDTGAEFNYDNIKLTLAENNTYNKIYVPYGGHWLKGKITGKNLLDYESHLIPSLNGLSSVINDDGSITTTGVPTGNWVSIVDPYDITDQLENGETYHISQKTSINQKLYIQISIDDKDTGVNFERKTTANSFTVDKSKYKYTINVQAGDMTTWGTESLTIIGYYQLEKGDVATEFEPYKEKEFLYNMNKYDEEGNLIGYHELSKRKETKDDLNFISGILNKKIGKYIFNGDENFHYAQDAGNERFDIGNTTLKIPLIDNNYINYSVSSHFKFFNTSSSFGNFSYRHDGNLIFFNNDLKMPDLASFKQFLKDQYNAGTPVTIYYVMETPEQYQLEPINVELFEGYNRITLEDKYGIVEEAEMTYLTDSKLNGQYASKVDLKLTAEGINQSVNAQFKDVNGEIQDVKGNVDLKLNKKDLFSEFNVNVDQVIINSKNFKLDKEGNITANDANLHSATFEQGQIIINDTDYVNSAITLNSSISSELNCQINSGGMKINSEYVTYPPTQTQTVISEREVSLTERKSGSLGDYTRIYRGRIDLHKDIDYSVGITDITAGITVDSDVYMSYIRPNNFGVSDKSFNNLNWVDETGFFSNITPTYSNQLVRLQDLDNVDKNVVTLFYDAISTSRSYSLSDNYTNYRFLFILQEATGVSTLIPVVYIQNIAKYHSLIGIDNTNHNIFTRLHFTAGGFECTKSAYSSGETLYDNPYVILIAGIK